MAWQTPKTNWMAIDVPLPNDFNRIEGNIDDLHMRFDPTTGHKHTGAAGDGPKLASGDITYSSAVSGFTPADVKAALDALAGVRIVEMGSNANGNYVRWENGLQICWKEFSSTGFSAETSGTIQSLTYYERRVTWTYPASFVLAPSVTFNGDVNGSGPEVFAHWSKTPSSVALITVYLYPNGIVTVASAIAIGRWK
ncbi:MAG TPA: hypothetical protein GXX51_12300 [Firmicutes bacterium]|nr:hypothetical protein [Bacillota bacterium]